MQDIISTLKNALLQAEAGLEVAVGRLAKDGTERGEFQPSEVLALSCVREALAMPVTCLHQIQEPAAADAPTSGAAALSEYLKTCEQHAIVPDVGGAFASAFAAGFNLAASHAAQPEATAAIKTLQNLGYTYHGAELWKPPIGKVPDFDLIDSLRNRISELEASQAAPAAVAVPDFEEWRKREYPWLGPIGDRVQIAREAWSAALAATPADHIADAGKMVAAPAGWKLVPVQVPDSAFPWVSGGYSTDYRAHDPRDQKIIEDRAQRTWEAILDGIAATPAADAQMRDALEEALELLRLYRALCASDHARHHSKHLKRIDNARAALSATLAVALATDRHASVERLGEAARNTLLLDPCKNTPELDAAVAAYLAAPPAAAPVVLPEPALYVSGGQLERHCDPEDKNGGRYIPARKTAAGLFATPLYTEPQLRALLATATGLPAQEPIAIVTKFHELGGEIDWTGRAIAPVGAKLYLEPQAQADARDAEITWPKARDIGRIGDMSQVAHIRVGFDSDNDVFVSVWDENGGGSIEFCNPGGGGGGQSSRTRTALIALMVAMEADNAEKPSRDWWAQRAAIAAAKGEQQ